MEPVQSRWFLLPALDNNIFGTQNLGQKLCGDHFTQCWFASYRRIHLKPGAVPTIKGLVTVEKTYIYPKITGIFSGVFFSSDTCLKGQCHEIFIQFFVIRTHLGPLLRRAELFSHLPSISWIHVQMTPWSQAQRCHWHSRVFSFTDILTLVLCFWLYGLNIFM